MIWAPVSSCGIVQPIVTFLVSTFIKAIRPAQGARLRTLARLFFADPRVVAAVAGGFDTLDRSPTLESALQLPFDSTVNHSLGTPLLSPFFIKASDGSFRRTLRENRFQFRRQSWWTGAYEPFVSTADRDRLRRAHGFQLSRIVQNV